MYLDFTDPGEFITELEQRPPNVEPVVRLIHIQRPARVGGGVAPFNDLMIEAAYLRRQEGGTDVAPLIVRLRVYCGELWGEGFEKQDAPRLAHANEIGTVIRAAVERAGLTTGGGQYSPRGLGAGEG